MNDIRGWYYKQATLGSVRINEWLQANPGRMTKNRQALVDVAALLGQPANRKEDNAHSALMQAEDIAWDMPPKFQAVVRKAIGSSMIRGGL